MNKYKIGHGLGVHTCRITLMEREFVGHVTFKLGGNCCGKDILEADMEYLEDPSKFESDCQLRYDEETYEYSFVLSDGEKNLEYECIDYLKEGFTQKQAMELANNYIIALFGGKKS